ncbi:MAG: NAD(+)--dinitrogen-reductase ADP-D-ribosyltransferase, partial [Gammaproteobacteria bacterium]|nr:NAD(+)--dinitrogen-reductase ADP-D-ribosyltransferase [Gammaproteobacteria bacterium]
PASARAPINRCNLPAEVLGDLSFQRNPKSLSLDGIAQLHRNFFQQLDAEPDTRLRSQWFTRYMNAHFQLETLDEAGYSTALSVNRGRANYLRILRGWFFDSDSQEGAIIKSWVESRFGLVPRYHQGPIRSIEDECYARFAAQRSRGLYNTNALEAQLDLLYSYCQYELARRFPAENSRVLYRGQNRLQSLEHMASENTNKESKLCKTVLLNNINSFTEDPARAGEFGDAVMSAVIPFAKLLFFSRLMPGIMTSEREYAVIGGVYAINLVTTLDCD